MGLKTFSSYIKSLPKSELSKVEVAISKNLSKAILERQSHIKARLAIVQDVLGGKPEKTSNKKSK